MQESSPAAYALISLMIAQLENKEYKQLEKTSKRMIVIAQKYQETNV